MAITPPPGVVAVVPSRPAFETTGGGPSRGRREPATAALIAFTTMLTLTVASLALPAVERDLGTVPGVSLWVLLGYALPSVLLIPPAARRLERAGPRRTLLLGAGGFAAATVLCGVAPHIVALIAARVLQGGFAALLLVLAPVLALRSARPVSALSVTAVCGTLGAFTGPTAGGGLLAVIGWRALLVVQLPLVVVVLIAGARALRSARSPEPSAFPAERAGGASRRPVAPAALAALAALAAFDGAVIALYPFFLFQGGVQQSPLAEVGLAMLALPAGVTVAGLAAGPLARRFGTRAVALAGAVVAAGGISLILPMSPRWTAVDVAVRLLAAGVGMGLSCGTAQGVALTAAPSRLIVKVASHVQMARGAGFVLGSALASISWGASVYSRAGFGTALLVDVAAALLAVVALVTVRSVTRHPSQ
ncbi:MFS transporter [Sphaerisporangium dianthi]|uniref:MFS transporter n=1 Tax=Sphaerisporangium dianthi TaxID=1436120 RepID=A0ABV9CQ90_9ACTN